MAINSTLVAPNDSSQCHYFDISKYLIRKPGLLKHKEMSFFDSVLIKMGTIFLF